MELIEKIKKSKYAVDVLFPLLISVVGYVAWWILAKIFLSGDVGFGGLPIAGILLLIIFLGVLTVLYKIANYYNKEFGLNYKSFLIHNLIVSYILTASITFIITSEFVKEEFNIVRSIFFPFFYWYFIIFTVISIGLLYLFFYESKKRN